MRRILLALTQEIKCGNLFSVAMKYAVSSIQHEQLDIILVEHSFAWKLRHPTPSAEVPHGQRTAPASATICDIQQYVIRLTVNPTSIEVSRARGRRGPYGPH